MILSKHSHDVASASTKSLLCQFLWIVATINKRQKRTKRVFTFVLKLAQHAPSVWWYFSDV